jgi:hypothetical protein
VCVCVWLGGGYSARGLLTKRDGPSRGGRGPANARARSLIARSLVFLLFLAGGKDLKQEEEEEGIRNVGQLATC